MTNGLLFYWVSWLLWGIVTFFLKKDRNRTALACWLLFSIFSSNIYFTIEELQILLPYATLIVVITILYTKLTHQLYHLFASFTIMIGYTATFIWKETTPLWLFIPDRLLVPIVSSLLILFLINGIFNQLVAGILSISIGELLYSIILSSYYIQKPIGDMYFFDNLCLTLLLLGMFYVIQKVNYRIYNSLVTYKRLMKLQNE